MADQRNGGIAWTDETWNPTSGCTKVSQGCKHCYAETMAKRLQAMGTKGYENGFKITLQPHKLVEPIRWTRPRRVFVNSMSDLFHENIPADYLDGVFAVMALAKQHTFQILTKRPERMLAYMLDDGRKVSVQNVVDEMETWDGGFIPDDQCAPLISEWPLPNVWLGVSVEDQSTADERIPLLLQTPATVRWVSAEPLLGAVHIGNYLSRTNMPGLRLMPGFRDPLPGIDWVVVGGESGHHARPMHPDWARRLRDLCRIAGVKFLFKQWGEWIPMMGCVEGIPVRGERFIHRDGTVMGWAGKKSAGRLLDGVLHDEFPSA